VELIRDVLPGDPMYDYAPELYWSAGEQAMDAVRLGLREAGTERVERILDFACGGGRVMRAFRAEWPDAEIVGAELWAHQLEFCAEKFGAVTVQSGPELDQVSVPGQFDLIWSGSMLTHVDERSWKAALRLWHSALRGVLVFTVGGPATAEDLRNKGLDALPDLEDGSDATLLEGYDETGFAFVPTVHDGWTIARPDWTRARVEEAGLRLLSYREGAWLGQDVVTCVPS
jgi:SAM-dependent methyltransferase